jgi:hypothetical protein
VKVIAVKMMSLLEPEDLVVVVCDEKAEVVRFLPRKGGRGYALWFICYKSISTDRRNPSLPLRNPPHPSRGEGIYTTITIFRTPVVIARCEDY